MRRSRRAKYQLRQGDQVLACALLNKQEVAERNEWGAGYIENGQVWKPSMVSGVAKGQYPKHLWKVEHD